MVHLLHWCDVVQVCSAWRVVLCGARIVYASDLCGFCLRLHIGRQTHVCHNTIPPLRPLIKCIFEWQLTNYARIVDHVLISIFRTGSVGGHLHKNSPRRPRAGPTGLIPRIHTHTHTHGKVSDGGGSWVECSPVTRRPSVFSSAPLLVEKASGMASL